MSTVALLFGRLYVIFEEEEKNVFREKAPTTGNPLYVIFEEEEKNGGRERKAIEMEEVVQSTHHGLSPMQNASTAVAPAHSTFKAVTKQALCVKHTIEKRIVAMPPRCLQNFVNISTPASPEQAPVDSSLSCEDTPEYTDMLDLWFELEDKQEQVQASEAEKQSNESDVHNIISEAPDWETFVEDLFGKK